MNSVFKKTIRAFIPKSILFVKGKREGKKVALTFDDGPNPANLFLLLELLEQESVTATFFLSGNLAEKYPDLVELIDASGHEIANHFYHHERIKGLSVDRIKEEVVRTEHAIVSLTGKPTVFIRPPYGGASLQLFIYCYRYKKTIVLWTNDSKDCSARSLADVIARLSLEEVAGGEIFLFHEDSDLMLESVAHTIKTLKEKGFGFSPVGKI